MIDIQTERKSKINKERNTKRREKGKRKKIDLRGKIVEKKQSFIWGSGDIYRRLSRNVTARGSSTSRKAGGPTKV